MLKKKHIALVCMGAENLGVEYLSAVLKQNGHKVKLFFDPQLFDDKYWLCIPFLNKIFDRKENIIRDIIEYKPDLIAFSVFTNNYQWACYIAKRIKEYSDVKIIFGGIHPTSVPEHVIKEKFVDYVIMGEGEYALLDLVEGKKDTGNIWYKNEGRIIRNPIRPLIEDLDSLPFADKSIFKRYIDLSSHMIMTTRDCPFNCSYCCNSVLHKMYGFHKRRRSPDNVIKELKEAKKKYRIKHVAFMDDIFTSDIEWLRNFLEVYKKEINLPFRCLSHPIFINDETIKMLKDANCQFMDIGIQSLDENIRKNILNRFETNITIKNAINSCIKFNLKINLDYIIGLPNETEQQLIDACNFFIEYKPNRLTAYTLSLFPGTNIINFFDLSKKKVENINNGLDPSYMSGGSTGNNLTSDYTFMFSLIPLLPKGVSKFILEKKLFKKLRKLHVKLILDIITFINTREYRSLSYFKYYIKNIIWKVDGNKCEN